MQVLCGCCIMLGQGGSARWRPCRHAGNLLVLQDQEGRPSGRVGFIDFGIVGRVTPVTWTALDALLTATATRDFDTMARALATVGATDTDVDLKVRVLASNRPVHELMPSTAFLSGCLHPSPQNKFRSCAGTSS